MALGSLGRFPTSLEYKSLAKTIYRKTNTRGTKPSTSQYAYEDDPTFLEFRSAVGAVCKRNDEYIDNSKLYALWYISKTFHRHWDERPSKKASNDMVFILGHYLLTDIQSQIVMMAWLKSHFPQLSQTAFEHWKADLFWPTWERIQPSIQQARDRKNARRRQKRKERRMKTERTNRKATLKNRILDALKQYPMTTAVLAAKLNAHPKAVDGHLSRMSKPDRAEVVRVGRGLYALPGTVDSAPAQPAKPVPVRPVVNPTALAEIREGVAEWKEPPVLEWSQLVHGEGLG